MIRMPHSIGTVLAAAGLAALAAGCTTGSSTAQLTGSLEKTNLVVASVPVADEAGLYVAQQQGFFSAAGLHVTLVNVVSSATAISGQLDGRYDITGGNYVSYILAAAKAHADLRIIAEGSVLQPHAEAILTPAGSPVTTIAGLRGKTIGVNVQNNIGAILVGSALEENGVPLADVHLKAVPFPEMATALRKHQVDAAWLVEPFVSSAEQLTGAQELFDVDQAATANFPIAGYATTRAWVQKYPRTAAAFTQALEKGQALADSNRPDAEQAMETYAGVSRQTVGIMALYTYPLGVDRIRLQRVADAMTRFGLLQQPFNIGQLTG
jgi:NitT/TauT family transport system substrate-binding protein